MTNRVEEYFLAQAFNCQDDDSLFLDGEKTDDWKKTSSFPAKCFFVKTPTFVHGESQSHQLGSSPSATAEIVRQKVRLASMEFELESLRSRVKKLESTASIRESSVGDPKIADVVLITQEMFGGIPTIEIVSDPEDFENPSVVITVRSSEDASGVIRKHLEWHDRIVKVRPGNSGRIRLSVVPN